MILSELADVLCFRVLLFLDERGLGAVTNSARHFICFAADSALWRHLALKRDPRAAVHVLSGLPAPGVQPDWRRVCRQQNPNTASAAWPAGEAALAAPAGLWEDLWDAGGPEEEQQGDGALPAADLGREGLWAGQSPHLFWLGAGRLLGVAGGYYAENMGGAEVRPLHDVVLIELPGNAPVGRRRRGPLSTRSPRWQQQGLRITPLTRGGLVLPGREGYSGHPQVHGAASDFELEGQRAIFFGGGSPHGQLTDATSALSLRQGAACHERPGGAGAGVQALWEAIATVGERPSPRQGSRGVVFEGRFIIFGGRESGGGCLDDVWDLALEPVRNGHRMWRRVECEGQGPSRRVWCAACHAVYGRWFVLGGSEWQFEEPAQQHDYSTLYVLELREMRWSTLAPPGPPAPMMPAGQPHWVVAAALVPLGSRQLLYLGGSMPHRVGPEGLGGGSMRRWREWYARLDRPLLFDCKSGAWSAREALLGPSGLGAGSRPEQRASEVLLRSHLAAVYVPERGSVIVLGGSRYFTGEYFHDLLELELPPAAGSGGGSPAGGRRPGSRNQRAGEELPAGVPPFMQPAGPEAGSRLTRGLRGRLRGMVRDGLLDQDHYRRILATF